MDTAASGLPESVISESQSRSDLRQNAIHLSLRLSLVVQGHGLDNPLTLSMKMANGSGTGTASNRCGPVAMKIRVDPSGRVSGQMEFPAVQCGIYFPAKLSGQAEGSKGIRLELDATTTNYRGRGKIRLAE